MEMTCVIREGVCVLSLRGKLDIAGTAEAEEAFQTAAIEASLPVAVDLSHVEFISSMGLRMLLTVARKLHDHHLRLVIFGPQWQVRESLEAAGLNHLIPSACTAEDALVLLKNNTPS